MFCFFTEFLFHKLNFLLVIATKSEVVMNSGTVAIVVFHFGMKRYLNEIEFFSIFYFHTSVQKLEISGTSVSLVSQVCAPAMLLKPITRKAKLLN